MNWWERLRKSGVKSNSRVALAHASRRTRSGRCSMLTFQARHILIGHGGVLSRGGTAQGCEHPPEWCCDRIAIVSMRCLLKDLGPRWRSFVLIVGGDTHPTCAGFFYRSRTDLMTSWGSIYSFASDSILGVVCSSAEKDLGEARALQTARRRGRRLRFQARNGKQPRCGVGRDPWRFLPSTVSGPPILFVPAKLHREALGNDYSGFLREHEGVGRTRIGRNQGTRQKCGRTCSSPPVRARRRKAYAHRTRTRPGVQAAHPPFALGKGVGPLTAH